MNKKFTSIFFLVSALLFLTNSCVDISTAQSDANAESHALKIIASYQRSHGTPTAETPPIVPTFIPTIIPLFTPTLTATMLPSAIAFVESLDDASVLKVRSADGLNIKQLTHNTGETIFIEYIGGIVGNSIVWSPDGKKIAVVSNEGLVISDIYVMNLEGSEVVRVTDNVQRRNSSPSWSPDGRQILFVSWGDKDSEINLANADGSKLFHLTNNLHSNYDPAWAPDGKHIAFASNRDGTTEIYVMNADGSGQSRLTYDSGYLNSLSWSPDGYRIMFVSTKTTQAQIYMMNADGSNLIRLTNRTASIDNEENQATWSPDGNIIAYHCLPGNVCSAKTDGSGTVFNYNVPDANFPLSWSPDSKYIAFSGRKGIYAIEVDSGQIIQIMDNTNVRSPVWSPVCASCP